jgi:hypothetical protein
MLRGGLLWMSLISICCLYVAGLARRSALRAARRSKRLFFERAQKGYALTLGFAYKL